MTIREFRGNNAFLSNFYYTQVSYNGKVYPTAEHAYQAQKTINEDMRETIKALSSPARAKAVGEVLPLRANWDRIKLAIMHEIVWVKFQEPSLRAALLSTSDEPLIETNAWNDTFWGICRGVGNNWLGVILMLVRSEIMEERE